MKLIFVYNANSGFLDRMLDNAHKIISPGTYDCNLCAITFGNFKEDEMWKAFKEYTVLELEFYHKDEFEKQFKSKWLPNYRYPVVLTENNNELELFMDAETINSMDSSEVLIEEIRKRV